MAWWLSVLLSQAISDFESDSVWTETVCHNRVSVPVCDFIETEA